MATPGLVQHVVYSTNGGADSGNAFKWTLPNPTLSGNCLVLALLYPSAATLAATPLSDNIGNSWPTTPNKSVTDSGNSMTFSVFVLPNATAGVTTITLNFTAAQFNVNANFQEWFNIATTNPLDGSAAQLATANPLSSGSFNTTVDGDLILQFINCTDFQTPSGISDGVTKFASGTGFTLSQTNLFMGYMSQYAVQATHGATNPSATVTLTASAFTFPSITIALKSASAGTTPNPAASRVFGLMHNRPSGNGGAGNQNIPVQFPTTGNAIVATASDPPTSITLVSVSGTVSGSGWATWPTSGENPQACYIINSVAGANELLTFVINDKSAHLYIQGCLYDLVNCGGFDTSVQNVTSTGFGPGNSTPTTSITPGLNAGVVICVCGIQTGPPDSLVSPSGGVFNSVFYTGETDGTLMDNGDLYATNAYTSNATQVWQFHNTAATTGYQMGLLSFGNIVIPEAGAVHPYSLPSLKLGTPISRLRSGLEDTTPSPGPVGLPQGEPSVALPTSLRLGTPLSRLRSGLEDTTPSPGPVGLPQGEQQIQLPGLRLGTPISRLRGIYDDAPPAAVTLLSGFGIAFGMGPVRGAIGGLGTLAGTAFGQGSVLASIQGTGALGGLAFADGPVKGAIAGTGALSSLALGTGSALAALAGKGALQAIANGTGFVYAGVSGKGTLAGTAFGVGPVLSSISSTSLVSGQGIAAAFGYALTTISFTFTPPVVPTGGGASGFVRGGKRRPMRIQDEPLAESDPRIENRGPIKREGQVFGEPDPISIGPRAAVKRAAKQPKVEAKKGRKGLPVSVRFVLDSDIDRD